MTIEHFLTFNLALLVAVASPGPAFIVAVRTTLTDGVSGGIKVGCGLALMAAMWTLVALLGLESVFLLFPWAYAVMKVIGAVYLFYIAALLWRSARQPIAESSTKKGTAFSRGLLVNLSNPKSVLFAAAVLVVIFPENLSFWQQSLIVLNHLLVELVFYVMLARVFGTETLVRNYQRVKVKIDRTASVLMGGLGLRILLRE